LNYVQVCCEDAADWRGSAADRCAYQRHLLNLSTRHQGDDAEVDITHGRPDAELTRLQDAIKAQHRELRRRNRFEEAKKEWLASGRRRLPAD